MTALVSQQPIVLDVDRDALELDPEITFNAWKRIGERYFAASGTVQWWLGDWWLVGQDRFAMDYHEALADIAHSHATVLEYARVARAFPPRTPEAECHRIAELTFRHHQAAASIKDPQERMAWLEDALRQGWSARTLQDELTRENAIDRRSPLVLSVKLVDDHYRIAVAKAERRGMDPTDWLLEAIREYDGPIPELEAA